MMSKFLLPSLLLLSTTATAQDTLKVKSVYWSCYTPNNIFVSDGRTTPPNMNLILTADSLYVTDKAHSRYRLISVKQKNKKRTTYNASNERGEACTVSVGKGIVIEFKKGERVHSYAYLIADGSL